MDAGHEPGIGASGATYVYHIRTSRQIRATRALTGHGYAFGNLSLKLWLRAVEVGPFGNSHVCGGEERVTTDCHGRVSDYTVGDPMIPNIELVASKNLE